MKTKELDRTLALCALTQAANLVDRLASQGQVPPSNYSLMRDSLFKFDSNSVEEIYQSYSFEDIEESNRPELIQPQLSQNLNLGLRVCTEVFEEGASHKYPQTIRYVMALIQLEKHFRQSPKMMDKVHDALIAIQVKFQNAQIEKADFDLASQEQTLQEQSQQQANKVFDNTELDAALSELYLSTLAKLPFRIQVLGKMQHLQNTENEHQVRVLLFAGIRAAMLLRQSGGRRWHFLLSKGSIRQGLKHVKSI